MTAKENIKVLLQATKIEKERNLEQQRRWRVMYPESGIEKWLDIRWRAITESICYANGKIAGYELALTCFRD